MYRANKLIYRFVWFGYCTSVVLLGLTNAGRANAETSTMGIVREVYERMHSQPKTGVEVAVTADLIQLELESMVVQDFLDLPELPTAVIADVSGQIPVE